MPPCTLRPTFAAVDRSSRRRDPASIGDAAPSTTGPSTTRGRDDHAADDRPVPGVDRFRAAAGGRRRASGGGEGGASASSAGRRRCRRAQLAAFAAARPAALLDRPDDEVGAAAAASRAARPAALTAVSEWAVDEVMVALGLSSRAAAGLLADSVTLDERLPATLAALEAGRISWAARAGAGRDRRPGEGRGPRRGGGPAAGPRRGQDRRPAAGGGAAGGAARRRRRRGEAAGPGDPRPVGAAARPARTAWPSLTAVMTLPVAQACLRALEAYAEACATPGR